MAKQTNTRTAVTDIQGLFDPKSYGSLFKTVAEMNERFAKVMVDAGERTTEITTATAKDTLSNLRDAAQVRKEPSDYAKAYGEFFQRQVELFTRTTQHLADVGQKTTTEATELANDAGTKMADSAKENVERIATTATSAAKKAA